MKNEFSYIALGSFDGIHKGHMSLIDKLISLSEKHNCKSVVYTFKNHPREIIKKNNKINLLMDNATKKRILQNKKIDLVYFQEFNDEFMKLSPEQFIKFLKNKFYVKGIVVGFNYRFGYKNMGDTKLLKELSNKYDYELIVMPPCLYEDRIISSTAIRKKLLDGKVELANKMLGRPYMLEGKVVHGRQIGRTIGFPTANLEYNKKSLLPKEGVYFTAVFVNNNIYKGITNIGNNPTVNGVKITVETYILDFDFDIYDKNIKVFFIKRIRDMHKFKDINALKEQLEMDKNYATKEKSIYNYKIYLQ